MEQLTITCDVVATSTDLGWEIWLDNTCLLDATGSQEFAWTADEDEDEHQLKFVLKNKRADHTRIDENNQIITTPTTQFFKRYQGIINNISINEEFNEQARIRTATCIMNCASFRTILQNRISGIRTNPVQWQILHPNDTSMNRVPAIVSQYFDFGKEPMRNTQSTTGASSDTSSTVNTDGGGA